MKKLGLGIIGLGVIAERLLPAFLKHPKTDIKGGFDVDVERMAAMKEKFDIVTVTDLDELINDKSIDMIYLAVPPRSHHDIAIKIMRAGKHILCEKPLACTLEEATEMYEVAIETQIVHAMNFPLYYGFAYTRIKQLLETNTLGRIKRIELSALYPYWPRPWQQNAWIDSREDGGFVREVFTHFIQLIQASFGPIGNIHSFVEYPDDKSKCEIGLIGVGELASGVKIVFNGLTDVNQQGNIKLTLFGSEGSIELQNWRKLIVKIGEQEFITASNIKKGAKSVNATYDLIHAFYEAIDGKKSNLVTFEDGLQATKVVEKLLDNHEV
ncbi:MAG: Gfo/Idh/MocA family protein [Chitinophagales bacterium]